MSNKIPHNSFNCQQIIIVKSSQALSTSIHDYKVLNKIGIFKKYFSIS